MKSAFCIFFAIFGMGLLSAQNPVSPPGIYIADPSAHVWNDGKLYIYGSLDESCSYYCSYRHHVLVTDDMKNWKVFKDALTSKGKGDAIAYNDNLLFAPDAAFRRDTFYIYYCQPDRNYAEGVATSVSPSGPFTKGKNLDLAGYNQIDPCVFTDDDGQMYYLWGQFTLKMAKMKESMTELDSETIRDSVLTEETHHFHEGAFLTKRNGIYYIVYADISRGDAPTCIGYATSNSPFGPYKYGGVIIDNNYCNPGNWNNHGSIAEFKGKWYVFYHRSTHGCNIMRKACVEPICFKPDGSIPEVEMTSQGAGAPLDAFSTIQAEWACLLTGNIRIQQSAEAEEELGQIRNGDKACYKYLDFGKGTDSLTITVSASGKGGKITLSLDKPWHKILGSVEIMTPATSNKKLTITTRIENITGIHALWFQFSGDENFRGSVDSFRFK
jgi:hypothetical protein